MEFPVYSCKDTTHLSQSTLLCVFLCLSVSVSPRPDLRPPRSHCKRSVQTWWCPYLSACRSIKLSVYLYIMPPLLCLTAPLTRPPYSPEGDSLQKHLVVWQDAHHHCVCSLLTPLPSLGADTSRPRLNAASSHSRQSVASSGEG